MSTISRHFVAANSMLLLILLVSHSMVQSFRFQSVPVINAVFLRENDFLGDNL